MPPIRREPPVFLVFIKGRWQSVPQGCGFAVSRRGKLEELRSGTVRAALRRLQLCLPSKARLGPRLSFKKIPPSGSENSDNKVNLIERNKIIIQNRDVRPYKRTRDTTSSEEPIKSVTTVATIHPAKLPKTSKNHQLRMNRLLSSESESSETSRTDSKNQKSKEIMESPKKSSVSSTMLDFAKRSPILRRKPVELTYRSKQSSPILRSKDLSEKQISRYLQPRSGKANKSPKKVDTILSDSDFEMDQSDIIKSKMKQIHNPKKISTISNSENGTRIEILSSNNHNKFHKIHSKRQKRDQDSLESQSPRAENVFQRPDETRQRNTKIGTCKELEIGEQDIELLRIFLQNHYSDAILLKFDADDEYKRMIFFRINPLVDIEWCPLIDRMLRRSQDSQLSLTDFASSLGLQSVTEAASIKTQRYKIRNRTEKSYVDIDSDSSSEDKENYDKMPTRIENTKILKEREHNMRESTTGENKAKKSKSKVSNKRVLTRKREESDPEVSITKKNNKKAGIATERTTRPNHKTVETESEDNNAKENNNEAGRAKKRTRRTSHITVESDSENNNKVEKVKEQAKTTNSNTVESNKVEKVKERAKTINRNTVESESEESNTNETHKKTGIAKKLTTRANHNTAESDSEASNTKENTKKARSTKKKTKWEVRNKVDSEAINVIKDNTKDSNAKKPTKRDKRKPGDDDSRDSNAKKVDKKQTDIDNTADTVELSSESETEEAVKAIKKTAKPKPVISSKRRRTNLEYSSLEDHAIVAWVSTGSRASRVNGNLLWRQLQDQYTQITGTRRTWHSLRNRYLRYILPKLGDLALPLSQQTRLRAAAATGEIKAHKVRSPRRNSIFKLPPRGAASKRIVQTYDETETEDKELPSKRSPSYSSLTREFTRRNNVARPSSELSDNSQRSNKLEVQDNKKKSEAEENSPRKPYKSINSPRKKTNSRATRNDHSDSDGRSDKDSSDSSGESEDESKKTVEPRRTRRSVNESMKRLSMRDTSQNTTESTRRLTKQSNILDESDSSKGRKSRDVAYKLKSAREKRKSPRVNLSRHKSPNEQSSRESSVSMSQSRHKSPENNRRRSRYAKKRDESDESKRLNSPRPINRSPMRKSNIQSSKGSSVSQVMRKPKSPIKRKTNRHDSTSEESGSSTGSVSQPRRKSNRIKPPEDRSNRRKSNRLTPNESSNKRRHSSESKRKSKLAKRDSLDEIVVSDSSDSFEVKKDLNKKVNPTNKRVDKQKMRRLFNPKAIL